MFKKAKEISDDKVQIAIQTYELVDKHIRKLDSDLAKFESEMKVPVILIIFFISSKSFFSPLLYPVYHAIFYNIDFTHFTSKPGSPAKFGRCRNRKRDFSLCASPAT